MLRMTVATSFSAACEAPPFRHRPTRVRSPGWRARLFVAMVTLKQAARKHIGKFQQELYTQ